jgi:hypothetical protein
MPQSQHNCFPSMFEDYILQPYTFHFGLITAHANTPPQVDAYRSLMHNLLSEL